MYRLQNTLVTNHHSYLTWHKLKIIRKTLNMHLFLLVPLFYVTLFGMSKSEGGKFRTWFYFDRTIFTRYKSTYPHVFHVMIKYTFLDLYGIISEFWERKLYKDLMTNYSTHIKPTRDPNKQIVVSVDFILSRIESLVTILVLCCLT